jgi:hypothetical protein
LHQPVYPPRHSLVRYAAHALPVCALVFIASCPSTASGQRGNRNPYSCDNATPPGTGSVNGMVRDSLSRLPLQSAKVVLGWNVAGEKKQQRAETSTARDGSFGLCGLPAGAATARAQFMSHASGPREVVVEIGTSQEIDLTVAAEERALVAGSVADASSGDGLALANLRFRGTSTSQLSDSTGRFTFGTLPPGVYVLDVDGLGYATVSDTVTVAAGSLTDIVVRLSPSAVPIPSITVVARSRRLDAVGFYERRRVGIGTFMTWQEIAKRNPTMTSDILRGSRGVALNNRRRGGAGSIASARGGCVHRFAIDGVSIGPFYSLDDMLAQHIEAIEIYNGPSEVPMAFHSMGALTQQNCGLIVIWTRDPSRR